MDTLTKLEEQTVPCNGCRICCQKSLILILPEHGDDPLQYKTKTLNGVTVLEHRENGDCIYLTDDGCGIHGRAPIICRVYSCVDQYRNMTRAERKKAIKDKLLSKDVVDAARARLHLVPATPVERPHRYTLIDVTKKGRM